MTTTLKTIKLIDSDGWTIVELLPGFSWDDTKSDLDSLGIIYCGGLHAASILRRTDKAPLLALGKCERNEICFRKTHGVYDYCVDMEFAADMIDVLKTAAEKIEVPFDTFEKGNEIIVQITSQYENKVYTYSVETKDNFNKVSDCIERAALLLNIASAWAENWESYDEFKFYSLNDITKEEFETMNKCFDGYNEITLVAFVREMYGYELKESSGAGTVISVTINE